jgi:hypothetical protein
MGHPAVGVDGEKGFGGCGAMEIAGVPSAALRMAIHTGFSALPKLAPV